MPGNRITAIIVSHGLETLLKFCIGHLARNFSNQTSGSGNRIIIVDNASPFPYSESNFLFQGLSLIRLDQSSSFSYACNHAAHRYPNDYYLLLNNDVLLAENTISSMLALFDNEPQAGICGTRLLFPDNTVQHAGVVFGPGNKGPYHLDRGKPAHIVTRLTQSMQAVTGACMLVRHQTWEELNGMDENYDFGLEDIDFCLRARQKGWMVYCTQETESLHFEAMTPGRVEKDIKSRKIFMDKWQGRYCLDG